MSVTLYVPGDAAALALGADKVAAAIIQHASKLKLDVNIVRNGSRGLFWLEPLVEVVTAQGRVAYGPVTVADVPGLFAANFTAGGEHKLRLGDIEAHPYLAKQQRVSLRRVGVVDPRSLDDYLAHGGGKGLAAARAMQPAAIVQAVTDSGLRGRGGAAFPTGIKWKTVLDTSAAQKYIVCNADEGDSGTFSDRMLMEGDPYCLIEGMAIAGLAVGANQGYIYVRSEYPHAIAMLNAALENAGDWLGDFSDRSAPGGRCLCVRRRDRAAGKHRRQARHRAQQAAAARHLRPVRPAHRHQQRHHFRQRAGHLRAGRGVLPRLGRGTFARHAAVPARGQPQIRRSGRSAVRLHPARIAVRLRRRFALGTSAARGASGRAARRVPACVAVRHRARLRGFRCHRRGARSRRHRRLRRHRGYGEAGALRHAILRQRILRQMHALPHRLHARRRGHRPHPRRRCRTDHLAAQPVRHHDPRLDVRDGRHDAVSGAVGAQSFPGGLCINQISQDYEGRVSSIRTFSRANERSTTALPPSPPTAKSR